MGEDDRRHSLNSLLAEERLSVHLIGNYIKCKILGAGGGRKRTIRFLP